MRYEVESGTNVVRIFDTEGSEVIYQPTWPNGEAWGSEEEATAWAAQQLLSITDPTADLAGPSPETPVIPRPVIVLPPTIPGVE